MDTTGTEISGNIDQRVVDCAIRHGNDGVGASERRKVGQIDTKPLYRGDPCGRTGRDEVAFGPVVVDDVGQRGGVGGW